MSVAGNQAGQRRDYDSYSTNPRWTLALLSHVDLRGEVWEPAAGGGAISDVLRQNGYTVEESDIERGHDFLLSDHMADTIVTNPPYRLTTEFILHGLRQSREMLCLLLGWHLIAGGEKRARDVWMAHPPTTVIAVAQRMPKMSANGTANSQFNHAWVVWDHKVGAPTELCWVLA